MSITHSAHFNSSKQPNAGGWKGVAKDFHDRINGQIKPEWRLTPTNYPLSKNVSNLLPSTGLFTFKQLEIISENATGLRDKIATRQYSAVEVAESFCRAAAVVHQATNCLMDFFPDDALARAKELDKILEKTGKVVGPLHGVPISIKDNIGVAGKPYSLGLIARISQHEEDATLVSILREAGAVMYCKTTCPQAVMHLESDSFLGPTKNPYNTALTSGGSSGGEGALISGGGSVMGIGTDVGGSVRSPASLCGIYGFKPTVGRLPLGGVTAFGAGQAIVQSTGGPMARSARDLALFMEVILATKPWHLDPTCVKSPWTKYEAEPEPTSTGRLKIGVMWDDGIVIPQPPMRSALQHAVEKLKATGVEIVDIKVPNTVENWEIARRGFFTDGGARLRKALKDGGEPMLPLTKWIMDQADGELSAAQQMELTIRRDKLRRSFHDAFRASGVDVILCPPSPGPAPVLGTSKYWGYTSMFNLLDVPAGVFPTGLSVTEEDKPDLDRKFLSKKDEEVAKAFSQGTFLNAPLSLQIVGAKWEDEKVVHYIQVISDIVNAP